MKNQDIARFLYRETVKKYKQKYGYCYLHVRGKSGEAVVHKSEAARARGGKGGAKRLEYVYFAVSRVSTVVKHKSYEHYHGENKVYKIEYKRRRPHFRNEL